MIRLRHKLLIRSFRLLDQLVMIGVLLAIIHFRPEMRLRGVQWIQSGYEFADTVSVLLLGIGWVAIYACCIRYKADRFVAISAQLKDLVKATTLASFWLVIISAMFSIRSINPANVAIFWVLITAVGFASRVILRATLIRARRSGYNHRFLLVIGANQRALDLATRLDERPELGYKVVGFVAENPEVMEAWRRDHPAEADVLGTLDGLKEILQSERVDEMMVCLPVEARFSDIVQVVQHARDLGVVVRLMPQLDDGHLLRSLRVEEFEGEEIITLFREQMLFQLLMKRLADVVISIAAMLLLSPLLLATALAIKLTSPGPVLFTQDRVGMNQRRFKLFKFRSMVMDAEDRKGALAHLNEVDGPVFKIGNDPRITPVGRLIRKTSIDELPQLINVLRGEMSLVGPRPPLPDEVVRYEWLFRKRLSVKPGITCVWQVSGRNNITFERWMQMDHDYIENWSLWLDLKILLKTVPAVFFGRGAS